MRAKPFFVGIVCISVAILGAACIGQDGKNPPLNSAIAAHGNTDWHIDTAHEFLFGVDMAGNPTAPNHVPGSWSRRHIHVGLSNTADFYYDSDLIATGSDTDATNGIDTTMLFFYAGHGCPTYWNTLGNDAKQQYMSLADQPGGGLLRYYWQCSCQVFAHGKLDCGGYSPHEYACPHTFDGSPDSYTMRNVYERWGPVLQPNLRMACGASTSAYCHETEANSIWDNYINKSYDVSDSFILGLHGSTWVIPLCITLGGSDVTKTPLYDATFTNQPNKSGTSHYHIEYLRHFATTLAWPMLIFEIPEMLPIFEVAPLPLPEMLSDMEFETKDVLMVSTDEVEDRGARVQINSLSGSVYVLGERKLTVDEPILEEEEYIERARSFIGEYSWTEEHFADPTGLKLMIETVPVEGKQDLTEFQKNVIVTFRRQIDVDGVLVNVIGQGGVMTVQMNNDGSLLNASKVWREIVGIKQWSRVKTFEEAYTEALEQIEDPQMYELDHWTWGYKEAAGSVEQDELRIVFHFWFVPADPETVVEYPPRMIEIPGQIEEEKELEDEGSGKFWLGSSLIFMTFLGVILTHAFKYRQKLR